MIDMVVIEMMKTCTFANHGESSKSGSRVIVFVSN